MFRDSCDSIESVEMSERTKNPKQNEKVGWPS